MKPDDKKLTPQDSMWWPIVLLRWALGAIFMVSGWAKAIDIWGFVFKLQDYLAAWDMWLPDELLVAASGVLSIVEFLTGVMLATGTMRRVGPLAGLALMAVMLPLTAYIALYNPVNDCGCFGDFIVLDNTSTFIKNVVLTAGLVVLLIYNKKVGCVFRPELQWLVLVISGIFCFVIEILGYNVQPLVDFRAFPPGTSLVDAAQGSAPMEFVYEKDGETRRFDINNLPDSSWTYVSASVPEMPDEFVVVDDEGDDVTSDVISDESLQLLLVVQNPDGESFARIHLADQFGRYMQDRGHEFTILVGTSQPERLERWRQVAMLDYDTYSVEPTQLKVLARGATALVMLSDGVVCWKRRLDSFPADYFDNPDSERRILQRNCSEAATMDLRIHTWLLGFYLAALVLIYLANFLFKKSNHTQNSTSNEKTDTKPIGSVDTAPDAGSQPQA